MFYRFFFNRAAHSNTYCVLNLTYDNNCMCEWKIIITEMTKELFSKCEINKNQTNCASNINEDINTWVMISTYTQWVTKTIFHPNCDAFSSVPSWIRGVQQFRSVCPTLFWIFVQSNMSLFNMSSYSRLCQRYMKHYMLKNMNAEYINYVEALVKCKLKKSFNVMFWVTFVQSDCNRRILDITALDSNETDRERKTRERKS